MIKVQNGVASREPLPAFLQGLAPESLANLSWADPSLGVADCAWLPEVDQSQPLGQFEKYGAESLTVGDGVVIVTREVLPMTDDDKQQARQAAIDGVRKLREAEYPDVREYLDGIVKGDQAQVQAYIAACLAVKAKYPKPE